MTKTYTLTVFNTCTSQYEDIEVTKEVYNEFRRGEWRIEKNDDKHRANETPFSELIGGDDGAFENFQEFFDNQNTPELQFEKSELINFLYYALDELRYEDYQLIRALFFDGLNDYEYAELLGVSHQRINKRKQIILEKLRKKLTDRGC